MTPAPRFRPPFDGPWLITFADLSAVMLAFFVMLFAMQDVEAEKWDSALDGLNRSLNQAPPVEPVAAGDLTVDLADAAAGLDLDYLAAILDERLAAAGDLPVAVERRPGALALTLAPEALFVGPRLSPDGAARLARLGEVVAGLRNRIDVVVRRPGTTATVPPTADWHQALVRATAVAAAMTDAGAAAPAAVMGRRTTSGSGRIEVVVRDAGEAR